MSGRLRAATDAEAVRLWPVVARAHLFDTVTAFETFRAEGPWRVRVSGDGAEAAVVERWREHLDVLTIKGLWSVAEEVPALVNDLAESAASQGFRRLLSPLVSVEVAPWYESAGMRVYAEMIVLRSGRETGSGASRPMPAGVRIRPARPADLESLCRIDEECFNEFWRYGADKFARLCAEDRMMVAEEAGVVIGYTLATVIRDSSTLGRLAVSPHARRRGVGASLLADALAHFERASAGPVTLCTQAENEVSRRLYAEAGLRELPARLVFLIRDVGGG